jgi:hypothetical protein
MPLHLIKLCVGAESIDDLKSWLRNAREGRDTLEHTTRMFPKRRDEILPGGSLYWVIKGMILCRQPIADLVAVRGKDGIMRCRIVFKAKIVPVRPMPRRAFQGWRYLEERDAPPDLTSAQSASGLPPSLRRELSELGLL